MGIDKNEPTFYDFKLALRMLKRLIVLYITNRDSLLKKGEEGRWYAIGYHLIGGSKYLRDRQYDAIGVLLDFEVPPTPDEVLEIRQGVSDRISEEY